MAINKIGKKKSDGHYLSGKEVRAIAKANAKVMRELEAKKFRKCDESEYLTEMKNPENILEIGTFTGYSALCMAAGLEDDAVIDTCEVDDELEMMILSFFERSAYRDKIRLHIGSALEIAPTLGECYDLVFIDGDKREYTAYYEMLFDNGLVRSGSWIMADNILWYGKVVEPVAKGDRQTQAIIDFNRRIIEDERVENVILPIRDGINLIRVK
jgi:predicted O-methyltransferase YrrM